MLCRVPNLICKLIQRQTYSFLSTKYGIWLLFCGVLVILVSAFHFGEVWLQWSASHYAGSFQFSRYYDNIIGRSFQDRLCLPQPIDIVYTWVNGSDPVLIKELNKYKEIVTKELGDTSKKRVKLADLDRFKWKSKTHCPVPNCVPAYKLALTGLPKNIQLPDLQNIHTNFTYAASIESWNDEVTIVSFNSEELIQDLIKQPLKYNNVHLNSTEVFYSSFIRNGHRKVDSTLLFYNLLLNSTVEALQAEIERQLPNSVAGIDLHSGTNDVGIIRFLNHGYASKLKEMSSDKNLTINHRAAKVLPVTYVWYPITAELGNEEDFGANRFADNEELKYSLRSVEKFAPWIRKIFIVTNGQIPNWLNLNHPRITLVTHDEIFLNKSHLPTFSSPAIESHIHRIPGLSKKFIYMNDDVFFGLPVWPDDFYTHSKGHKVYLSWAVPNCAEGCPASWINDKYCDKACNVSSCEWDGGDCLGPKANNKWSLQVNYNHHIKTSGEYCSPGCAHNWIGDRYCDANCNTKTCGFDAGDCGLNKFKQLYSIAISKSVFTEKTHFLSIPKGTLSMYFNLSNIFHSLVEGNFQENQVLRTAVISKKFKILSLTFFKNVTETKVSFQVLGYKGSNNTDKGVAHFSLNVSTLHSVNTTKVKLAQRLNVTTVIKYPEMLYKTNESDIKSISYPKEIHNIPNELSNLTLHGALSEKLKEVEKSFKDGEITEFGYNRSKSLIYSEYLKDKNERVGRKLLSISEEMGLPSSIDNDLESSWLNKILTDYSTTQFSFLPWEKNRYLNDYAINLQKRHLLRSYELKEKPRRHLMDAFSSSLLHVSRVYNKEFGYIARKVPAHMPHMVDRDILYEMQDKFFQYYDATSSHKLRHPEDMQFAFSFNYYLIGMKVKANLSEVFDKVDSDNSGFLSASEQRTLAAMLYQLPLDNDKIKKMEQHLNNCSQRLRVSSGVNKQLFLNCHELWQSLNLTAATNKYPHEVQGEDDVIFKMIRNNVTYVLNQLDWIRKNRKKFICLNDDLDHAVESTKTIRGLLKDFYESFFPIRSRFELAPEYRNKYVYKWQLDLWLKENGDKNKKINVLIVSFIVVFLFFLFRRKIVLIYKRLNRIYLGYGRSRVLSVPGEEKFFI